jgi:NADH-quinone oxidoreductase subunit J
MYDIVFLIAGLVCAASAMAIVLQKNPVYSVVYMLPFFLGMTTLFVLLSATFLAAIQMIVYGGAILVVFLFVIMLINLKPDELRDDFSYRGYGLSCLAAGILAGSIAAFVLAGVDNQTAVQTMGGIVDGKQAQISVAGNMTTAFAMKVPETFGSTSGIAPTLFKFPIVVPFELASILIVVAILGAVLLSKKRV